MWATAQARAKQDGRLCKEMGEKSLHNFFFRNGSGRETAKPYNTYPGTLALKGNCLCRSSVVSLVGFRFKVKGINLAGSSAQESYSQKKHNTLSSERQILPKLSWSFPLALSNRNSKYFKGRGRRRSSFTLGVPHLIIQRLGKGHQSIWHGLCIGHILP